MTKKRSSEILADERMKIVKFSTESENFSKIGGNLKQGEMHHGLRGMDAHAGICKLESLGIFKIEFWNSLTVQRIVCERRLLFRTATDTAIYSAIMQKYRRKRRK